MTPNDTAQLRAANDELRADRDLEKKLRKDAEHALCDASELLEEIMRGKVNPEDEAEKWLRTYDPIRLNRRTDERGDQRLATKTSANTNGTMIRETDTNTEAQPASPTAANGSVLRYRNKEYRFNDHVCMEMLIGVPDEERTGRLVQVRKGCGQFGSDIYLVRLRDMSLMRFENVLMRHANDRDFERTFYLHNNRQPPAIPHQEPMPEDSPEAIYTFNEEYPETGFIIEKPSQPPTPGSFSMIVSTQNDSAQAPTL